MAQIPKTSLLSLVIALLLIPASPQLKASKKQPVFINEIAWMGTITSASDEWIELLNNSDNAIILNGWTLKAADGTPHASLAGTIAPMAYYLLERTNDSSVPKVKADKIYAGSLANSGEDLLLYDSQGNLVDQADFSSGWTVGDNTTKQTAERTQEGTWQTSKDAGGTPGASNSSGKTIIEQATADNRDLLKIQKSDKTTSSQAALSYSGQNYNNTTTSISPSILFFIVAGTMVLVVAGWGAWKLKNKQ